MYGCTTLSYNFFVNLKLFPNNSLKKKKKSKKREKQDSLKSRGRGTSTSSRITAK